MTYAKVLVCLLLLFFVVSIAAGAEVPKGRVHHAKVTRFQDNPNFVPRKVDLSGMTKISRSPGVSVVQGAGNSFYDYQTNGGDEKRVRVLPDGSVHVVYMGATDRAAPGGDSRGTYYAYSTDNGTSFTNLGRVEPQRAGFPALDVTSDGRAVVTSHTAPSGLVLGVGVYEDALPGFAIFSGFDAPRLPIECIWPRLTITSANRYLFWGSSNTAGDEPQGNSWNSFDPSTFSFGFAENQLLFPDVETEIRGTIAASPGGKVAMILINGFDLPPVADFGNNNLIMRESADGGLTFGAPVNITNYPSDTLNVRPGFWLSVTALYVNEELHIVWTEVLDEEPNDTGISYFFTNLYLRHWSPNINGGVPNNAARWDSVHFGGNDTGVNHLQIDYPSIGMDADGILSVAFTGFSGDSTVLDPVTNLGFGDIWAVSSADNGATWGEPTNLTNSVDMDDRYPYLSPWNESGKINLLYMSDSVSGNFIGVGADGAPTTTPDFLFLKVDHPSTDPYDFYTSVEDRTPSVPKGYWLGQNYPNPFNPVTSIEFSLAANADVRLEIFSLTGQVVTTLVNGKLPSGYHKASWDASGAPTGVYFYRLEANDFTQTKRLVLMK